MIPSCHTSFPTGPACFSLIYLHSLLTQVSPVQHVKHTAWRANDDVRSLRLEFLHFVPHIGASNAGMARSAHVVTQGQDDLLNLESREKQIGFIRKWTLLVLKCTKAKYWTRMILSWKGHLCNKTAMKDRIPSHSSTLLQSSHGNHLAVQQPNH